MKYLRLSIVGFGVVGRGLAELLQAKREFLQQNYSLDVRLVSVASGRQGFVYHEDGLDIPTIVELARKQEPFTGHPGVRHWHNALEGLRATEADVLVEATGTNLRDAEPGISHIRAALTQGMHVISANKGPIALAARELFSLARKHGVQLHEEATVMAGTPVLSTLQEGMAGAQVLEIRGILNGTTNYILSAMATGREYADVLAEAQHRGYAEADPTADVEGYDTLAKALILAALAYNCRLTPDQVIRQGITTITKAQVQQALAEEKRIKLIASLRHAAPGAKVPLDVRVEPVALPLQDPLAQVEGVMNAITFHTDTLSDVTIIGPGAGGLQTAQGLLADLIAVANTSR